MASDFQLKEEQEKNQLLESLINELVVKQVPSSPGAPFNKDTNPERYPQPGEGQKKKNGQYDSEDDGQLKLPIKLVHGRHHPGIELPTGRKIRPSGTHDKDSRVHQRYIMDDYGGQIKNPDYVPYFPEERILDLIKSIKIKPDNFVEPPPLPAGELEKMMDTINEGIPPLPEGELEKIMDMINGLQISSHKDLTKLLTPFQDKKGSLRDSGLSDEQKKLLLQLGIGAYKRA